MPPSLQDNGSDKVSATDDLIGIGAWSYQEYSYPNNQDLSSTNESNVLDGSERHDLNDIEQYDLDLVLDHQFNDNEEYRSTRHSGYPEVELKEHVDGEIQLNKSGSKESAEAKQSTTETQHNEDVVQITSNSHGHCIAAVATAPLRPWHRQYDPRTLWSHLQSPVGVIGTTVATHEGQGIQPSTSLQLTSNDTRRPRSYSV